MEYKQEKNVDEAEVIVHGLMTWEKKYRSMEVAEECKPYWNAILEVVEAISFMEIVEKIDEFPGINS